MSADEENAKLATAEFWDTRYNGSNTEQPTHEWFRSFDALQGFFENHLYQEFQPHSDPRLIHLGSGDSTVPGDLLAKGYRNQLCVDFSQVVVDSMSKKTAEEEGIEWQWADVRDMPDVKTSSVDVAFDKGTLDAMIHGSPWSPPDEVLDNTSRYLDEVFRILKPTGVFLYVTYRQPHFMRPLLNRKGLWDMKMDVLTEQGSFDYYGFILRKQLS